LQATILFAQEIFQFFALNTSFKFNISTLAQCKSFLIISGGSRNNALSMYIHLKSLNIVTLSL
jgi:hypothetical protein